MQVSITISFLLRRITQFRRIPLVTPHSHKCLPEEDNALNAEFSF